MRKVLVIGPHFDDAVLSAGQFLAGRPDAVVLTVFGGVPRGSAVLTSYDQLCGFKNAEEAVRAREAENAAALALLGCTPHNLAFVDSQYGKPSSRDGIAKCIARVVGEYDPEFVVGPLGLVHPDHELVRDALLDPAVDLTIPVWLYEDIPSRVTDPETVQDALHAVAGREDIKELALGFVGTGTLEKKMSALWCYRSQLSLFPNHHELLVGERFWQVVR